MQGLQGPWAWSVDRPSPAPFPALAFHGSTDSGGSSQRGHKVLPWRRRRLRPRGSRPSAPPTQGPGQRPPLTPGVKPPAGKGLRRSLRKELWPSEGAASPRDAYRGHTPLPLPLGDLCPLASSHSATKSEAAETRTQWQEDMVALHPHTFLSVPGVLGLWQPPGPVGPAEELAAMGNGPQWAGADRMLPSQGRGQQRLPECPPSCVLALLRATAEELACPAALGRHRAGHCPWGAVGTA